MHHDIYDIYWIIILHMIYTLTIYNCDRLRWYISLHCLSGFFLKGWELLAGKWSLILKKKISLHITERWLRDTSFVLWGLFICCWFKSLEVFLSEVFMRRNMSVLSVLERDGIKYRSRISSCSNFFDSHQLIQETFMSEKYITTWVKKKKKTYSPSPRSKVL